MTELRFRRRLSGLVSSATNRAKQAVPSRQAAEPPPTARPSIRNRIVAALDGQGFEAAEQVIREQEAELWAYLARVGEPVDRARALGYAQRAIELDPRPQYFSRYLRLANALGVIRLPQRILEVAEDFGANDEVPATVQYQLSWFRVWRGLLEDGFPLPARRSEPAFRPLPNTVLYCLHNSLPHDSAGYATRSHGILQGLRNAGMNMLPYTRFGYPWDAARRKKLDPIPAYADRDEADGITYHRLRTLDTGWGQVPLDCYMQSAAEAVEQAIRVERPSIVHAASNYITGLPSVVAALRLGLPVVYEVRGLWEITRASREPAWKTSDQYEAYVRLETEAANGADAVITLTEALKAELVGRGVPAERITVVPNSVDPDLFTAEPRDRDLEHELGFAGRRVVGYVGSFTGYEGLDDLLHATTVVIDRGVDLRLLLVGDGAELPRLRELVAELELGDHVVMPGRVPFADVHRYYSLIDVAVFPRKPLPVTEMVSPMKPFEAMATKKAILVSSVGALAEIVQDGETGLVFQKGDIDSLADALERMVRDPDLCRRLGENAREWVVANRSWQRAAATVVDVYRSVGLVETLPALEPGPGFPATVWKRLNGKTEATRHEAILRSPWTGRVLDLGTDRGFVACLIASLYEPDRLVVVEPSKRFLAQAVELAAANRVARFAGITGTGQNLPFAAASFDRVLISEALAQSPDPGRLLAEAARVLAPNGTALVVVPRPDQASTGEDIPHLAAAAGFRPLERRTVETWDFHLLQRLGPDGAG
jgi:PEP-CTERM/exosortase A-associated glycosyltransferase